nr:MAG TPA: hypothetical protein [Caudoviricetes sp.]
MLLLHPCSTRLLYPHNSINSYMAGITIFYFIFKVRAGNRPACVPVRFSSPSISLGRLYYIKHIWQSSIAFVAIIGKNGDFF